MNETAAGKGLSFVRQRGDNLELDLLVSTSSRSDRLLGIHGNRLKVALRAPPVDGKANAALLSFFSQQLGISLSQISLLRGPRSRNKTISINGLSYAAWERWLDSSLSND